MIRHYPPLMLLFILLFLGNISANTLNGDDCIQFTFVPADETIDCNEDPYFTIPMATDTCCTYGDVTFTKEDTSYSDGCTTVYERTWIATSSCGNSASVVQTITQTDSEPPTFVLNDPQLAGLSSGSTITQNCDEPFILQQDPVSVTDNCDPNPSLTMFDISETGNCPQDGYVELLTCHWYAEDECGNKDTFTIFIKFIDEEAPTIYCPADQSVECDQAGGDFGTATADDNCDDYVHIDYNDNIVIVDECETIIERKWTATDHCWNKSSCVQKITLTDTTAPEIWCPDDKTLECDTEADPGTTGYATADDNCDDDVDITWADDTTYVTAQCEYIIERTWTASDDCGNASYCVQTLKFEDTTKPSLWCPSDVTLECDENGDPSVTGYADATDNCDDDVDITWADDTTYVTAQCEYYIERTWTATDDCGNSDYCVQRIDFIDTTPPHIDCPNDVTIECDVEAAPSVTGYAYATDNCDDYVDIVWYDDTTFVTANCEYVIDRKWTATDDCGNIYYCIQTINVEDTTKPSLWCPADAILECDENGDPSETGYADATDNCDDDVDIVWADDTTYVIFPCEYIIERTWTAIDDCGNSSACVQTLKFEDTTAPIIYCPDDLTLECDANADPSPTIGYGAAVDNCDFNTYVTWADDTTYITAHCEYIIERTWTATDACGNSSYCVQTLKFEDTTKPSLWCPADKTLECDAMGDPDVTGYADATDNCDDDVYITWADDTTYVTAQCEYYIERTWTATDDCGNSDYCVQRIDFIDTTPPHIDCPNDVTIECDVEADPFVTGYAYATDNCDDYVDIVWEDDTTFVTANCEYVIERKWTAEDDCGNTYYCIQTINVEDTTKPDIWCPSDVTLECDETGDPSTTGYATATDNCDDDVDIVWADDTTYITAHCEYLIERTWTATDDCGNQSACIQKIKFEDTTNPDIWCPDDATLECDEEADPSYTGYATATDNCDYDVDITWADDTTYITAHCEYIIERTWTATDDCGNSSYCVQTLKFEDTTKPSLWCPADKTLECDATGDPSTTGYADATDNCDDDVYITWADDTTYVTAQCEYYIERTWTATDDCGNSDYCVQRIDFIDTTPPHIDCPADVTIECDVEADPSYTGHATATDNCDDWVDITWYDDTTYVTPYCEYLIERKWTAEDDCGNTYYCVQNIKVEDTTSPDLWCPSDVTLECHENGDPSVTGYATATDNCDNDVDIVWADDTTYFTANCDYLIERTWTATDDCGNVSYCVQNIKFEDTTSPDIWCPDDKTLECDEEADPAYTGTATAFDNCDVSVDITWADDTTYITAHCEYIIERTWTATDDCGNSSYCVQTLKFEDTTKPSLWCPADKTLECDATGDPSTTGYADATDNCDDDVYITWADDTTYVTAQCEYYIERTWTATDDCGNSDYCVQRIDFIDTTPPHIDCPADVTIECDVEADPSVTGHATATDNCDDWVDITWYDDTTYVTANCAYLIDRKWTAEDDCGNTYYCIQKITVEDTTSPDLWCPADATLECDENGDPSVTGYATATDNCDDNVDIVWADDTTYVTAQCEYYIERTWTATDDCGNSSYCVQRIDFIDTTPPHIDCPADVTIECDEEADPSYTGHATATDNCDNWVDITWYDDTTFVVANCDYLIKRKWTAEDDCGNTYYCVQNIKVEDTTNPNLWCPSDVTLECNENGDPSVTGYADATDNCDDDVEIIWADDTTYYTANCDYLIERTWIATDDCGNASVCIQSIKFDDTTKPDIWCPSDVTLECDETGDPSTTGYATATDNCDDYVDITWADDTTYYTAYCDYLIERTWTATDDCGNTSYCVQNIKFEDTTNPDIWCPADATLECDENGDPSVTGYATATDNCDDDVYITWADDTTYVTAQCEYYIERTWTATDDCGNVSYCVQRIDFIDTTPPHIDCPAGITIECDVEADPSVTGHATATDNCDDYVDITWYDDTTYITPYCEYLIERKWTAEDDCGNTYYCIQDIKVEDTTAPSIWCPSDVTIECDEDTSPANTGYADATDNCDNDVEITYTDEVVSSDSCTAVVKRTWTATDDCGNYEYCTQVITITDTTAPEVFPVHPDWAVYNDGDIITVECDMLPIIGPDAFAATDNCDDNVEITFEENVEQLDCSDGFKAIMECTWIGTDNCGNTDEFTLIFKVVDNTAPTLIGVHPMVQGAQDGDVITVNCQDFEFLDETAFTATDNCDGDPIVTFEEVSVTTADCVTDAGLKVSMVCRWIATDACGNETYTDLTFNVVDTEAPQITGVPDDIILACADIPDVPHVEAWDNCAADISLTFEEHVETNDDYTCTLIRKWTARDDCGNESVAKQNIKILDCQGCFAPGAYGFIDFGAALNTDSQAQLEWEFSAVPHNHLFVVERSQGNNDFQSVGILEGNINFDTEGSNKYTFTDPNPQIGFNFYRVKAMQADKERPIFSEVRSVQLTDEFTPEFRIYPNPTTGELVIDFTVVSEEASKLTLVNELGQVLVEENMARSAVRKVMDLSDYPSGVYFIHIAQGTRKPIAQKIVKMD